MQKKKAGVVFCSFILFFFLLSTMGCITKKPAVKETVTVGPDEQVIVVPKDRNVLIPGEKILEIPGEGDMGGTLILKK